MKVLVTGGAGFIGSHVAEQLVSTGNSVRIIDNFSMGKVENIEHFLTKIELIQEDFRDKDVLGEALKDIEVIFHLAAMVSVPESINNPSLCHETNVMGPFNLLKTAHEMGVRRVVLSSSSAVYGESNVLSKTEGLPFDLRSPYAASKAQMELEAKMFTNVYGLETVCLRYFNVYGPRQNPNSQYAAVIPNFINNVVKKQSPIIYGDGKQTRDFIHVSDVVRANLLAADVNEAVGKVFNVGTGRSVSLNELIHIISQIVGEEIKPIYTEPRPGDIQHSNADIEQAKRVLCFKPTVGLHEGLSSIFEDFIAKETAVVTVE